MNKRDHLRNLLAHRRIDYLVLLGLAAVPFWGIGFQGLWQLSDTGFDTVTGSYLARVLSGRGADGFPGLPVALIWTGLSLLGLPLELVQRVYLFGIMTAISWGAYFLVGTIINFQSIRSKRLAGLIAASYYVFNSFVIQRLTLGADFALVSLAAFPFLMAFVFKTLHENKSMIKNATLASVSLAFVLVGSFEISLLALTFLTLFLMYEVTLALYSGKQVKRFAKKLLTIVVVPVVLNLWFIIPGTYILFSTNTVAAYGSPQQAATSHIISSWPQVFLNNALRLQMYPTIYPMGFVDWWRASWIGNPGIVAIGLGLTLLAFLGIALRPRDKYTLFFGIGLLMLMGLATGSAPPLGYLFDWLWNNFLLFHAFKEEFKFFQIAVLCYGVLLGISSVHTLDLLNKFRPRGTLAKKLRYVVSKGFGLIIISLIVANSFPLASGNLGGFLQTMSIPQYYHDASQWLSTQPGEFNLMEMLQTSPAMYPWGPQYAMSSSLGLKMFAKSVLKPFGGSQQSLPTSQIENLILNNQTTTAGKMLSLLNVKYIYVSDDSQTIARRDRIIAALQRQTDLSLSRAFGPLLFYRNLAFSDMHIYAATSALSVPSSAGFTYYKVLSEDEHFLPNEAAILDSEKLPNTVPQISHNVSQYFSTESYTLFEPWSASQLGSGWIIASYDAAHTVQNGGAFSSIMVNSTGSFPKIVFQPMNGVSVLGRDLISFQFRSSSRDVSYTITVKDRQENVITSVFTPATENSWETYEVSTSSLGTDDIIVFVIQAYVPSGSVTFWTGPIESKTLISAYQRPNNASISLSYEQTGPNTFRISVETQSPIVVVLSEAFNPYWRLRFSDMLGSKIEHFRVNFYSNGWFINRIGKLVITVDSAVVDYLGVGSSVSFIGAGTIIILSLFTRYWKRRWPAN